VVDKKQIKRNLNQLRRIKTWQLVILLILAGFVAATFLRLNNIGMVDRRNAVVAADIVGDNSVTTSRLYDLQRYVSAHMNTDMGKGLYLEASYKRDLQAAYTRASGSSNGNIYKKAQEVCAPRYTSWSPAYVQCSVTELAKYPAADALVLPKADLYLHSFVSPLWSPDFAGWSLVVCCVILLIIIARITSVGILKLLLSRRYKSI
jgi:hypothetical protein